MFRRLRRLSIRAKLLWMVVTLLTIPWLGYNYVSEMKKFLLQGQQEALSLTAHGIATVLNDREELFAPETSVPTVLGENNNYSALKLDRALQLDGDIDDWGNAIDNMIGVTANLQQLCHAEENPDDFSIYQQFGYYQQTLYTVLDIVDSTTVYRDLERFQLDTSDHIRVLMQYRYGALQRYVGVMSKPGRMSFYLVDDDWRVPLTGDPVTTFVAEMRETEWGYRIEMRLPNAIRYNRARVAFFAVDVDDEDQRQVESVLSTQPNTSESQTAQILLDSPEITKILTALDRPESRIWIIDRQLRVRSLVGGLRDSSAFNGDPQEEASGFNWVLERIQYYIDGLLQRPADNLDDSLATVTQGNDPMFLQVLEGEPAVNTRLSKDGRAQIVLAGYPIRSGEDILGAVVVEQSAQGILALQYRLLRSLVLLSLLVFLFVTLMLLIFAWRLTVRIRRLHTTTERAITREGRVLTKEIPNRIYPKDELGDLGRSITNMLTRLSGYTQYLEGMPDTLAHELNNPLNVVSSSLEMLGNQQQGLADNKYMQRASSGVLRLRNILTNLTEAVNLEDAMRNEIKERFELTALLREVVEGYQHSLPESDCQLMIDHQPVMISGSPDHIAQLLDKLVDNASEFSNPDMPIIIRVGKQLNEAYIEVINDGPELPSAIIHRLFDPMVSAGKPNAKQSHLGLGLFVVRLIAEYHDGKAYAENRSDEQGVKISVWIPLSNA